jgi:hypothetical protein
MVNNDVIPRKHLFCVVAEAWIFNNIAAIGVSDVLFKACPCDLILKAVKFPELNPVSSPRLVRSSIKKVVPALPVPVMIT